MVVRTVALAEIPLALNLALLASPAQMQFPSPASAPPGPG